MIIKIGKQATKRSPTPRREPAKTIKYPSLKMLIHKSSKKNRKARHHRKVHASDLDPARSWCPREVALLEVSGRTRPDEFLPTCRQVTFSMGYAASDLLERFTPEEVVWGAWKCRACGEELPPQHKPTACPSCGAKKEALRYREVFMRDPDTGVVGSCDLWVGLDGRVLTAIECKSEGKDTFAARTAPDFDHVWRTRFYLWLASVTPWLQSKPLNLHDARIVYVCKSGFESDPELKAAKIADQHASPFKEYVVERDDVQMTAQMERVREWTSFYAAITKGASATWPEGVCSDLKCSRASRCTVRDLCGNAKGDPTGKPARSPL